MQARTIHRVPTRKCLRATKEAKSQSQRSWEDKNQRKHKQGTGYAFRITKELQQEKHVDQTTVEGKSAGLRAQYEKQVMQWKGLWEAQEELSIQQKRDRVQQINETIGQCGKLDEITAEEVRSAALSFKIATVYVDVAME